MKKLSLFPIVALLLFVLIGCEKDRVNTEVTGDEAIESRGKDCFNFQTSFEDCINWVVFEVNGVTYQGVGAKPAPGNVGEYEGYWASIILEERISGNGATHYKLIHKFVDEEGDYFYTDDKAVCAPATGTGITCMINDQMTIVGGTGKFASVSGKIKTHGPIIFGDPACPFDYGSLSLTLHGHVCLN